MPKLGISRGGATGSNPTSSETPVNATTRLRHRG